MNDFVSGTTDKNRILKQRFSEFCSQIASQDINAQFQINQLFSPIFWKTDSSGNTG